MGESGIFKLPLAEVAEVVVGVPPVFPKYTTQILNLANQTAQGTRPKVVGQMSDLVKDCPEKTYKGWIRWYEAGHPKAIEEASDRIWGQVQKYQAAAHLISREMVESWVRDLVLAKTFVGLKTQDTVLDVLSQRLDLGPVKRASPAEEAQGIDGHLGTVPVSIKPETYRSQILPERISVPIVYYEKLDDSLVIDARELLKELGKQ